MPLHTPVFDATGLVTLRSVQVIENMVDDLKSKPAWGSATQAESDDALAQLLAPTGDAIGLCYELLQAIWDAWDPDAAIGTYQDNLYWILGLIREPAAPSFTQLEITGGQASGTVPAGKRCRVPDGPFWVLQNDAVLDPAGDGVVDIESVDVGPVQATNGTITEIVDSDPAWDGATISNPNDAELGQLEETAAAFRARRLLSISRVGNCTDQAHRGQLEALDDVTRAVVISNRTLATVDGIPGKAYEPVLWPDPAADEEAVAEVLWANLPGGINIHGDVEAIVTDSQGFQQTVRWSYADPVLIYWEVDVTTKEGYPADGDDQVAAAVLAYGNSLAVGEGVEPVGAVDRIRIGEGDAEGVPGVKHLVVRVKAGSAPGAGDTIPVDISQREVSDHDLARITVNQV